MHPKTEENLDSLFAKLISGNTIKNISCYDRAKLFCDLIPDGFYASSINLKSNTSLLVRDGAAKTHDYDYKLWIGIAIEDQDGLERSLGSYDAGSFSFGAWDRFGWTTENLLESLQRQVSRLYDFEIQFCETVSNKLADKIMNKIGK
jgi:hypothetical protein